MDYIELHNKMELGVEYTAKDLGVAGATMTALVRRGLVEKIAGKPARYKKLEGGLRSSIISLVKQHGTEFFVVHKKNEKIGMQCSLKGNDIVDAWGKVYDITGASKLQIFTPDEKFEFNLEDKQL